MLKLIATDIDGTLLQNGETEIRPEFFSHARRLMEKGIRFCAASGRQYDSLRRLFAPIAKEMYFLCENGAAVFAPGGQLLSKTVIDRSLSIELCRDILAQPDTEVLISGTNMSYICPKTPEYIDLIRNFLGNNTTVLPAPEDMPEDFLKISAYLASGAAALEPLLKPRWQEHFQVAIAGHGWLDFTAADKGTGIRALCRALSLQPEEVMAFGDNYNDCAMLDAVGHPLLMEAAAAPLRERYANRCDRVETVLASL